MFKKNVLLYPNIQSKIIFALIFIYFSAKYLFAHSYDVSHKCHTNQSIYKLACWTHSNLTKLSHQKNIIDLSIIQHPPITPQNPIIVPLCAPWWFWLCVFVCVANRCLNHGHVHSHTPRSRIACALLNAANNCGSRVLLGARGMTASRHSDAASNRW